MAAIRLLNILVSLLLMAASLLVIANVFLRYIFNSSIFGSDDIILLLILWMSFLGMIIVQQEKKHFAMPLLAASLSKEKRERLEIFNLVLQTVVLILFAYSTFLLWNTYSQSVQISLGINKTIYAAAAIAGAGGMLLAVVTNLLRSISRKK